MAAAENRRIALGVVRYVVKTVEAADSNGPRSASAGPTDVTAGYSTGPPVVDEPWEISVSTTVAKLDDFVPN
jgi:hypothetical protein